MTDLRTPKYALSDVAEATGVLVGTIRGWAQRKELTFGDGDIATVVPGSTRRVTGHTVLAVAVASALMHSDHREAAFLAAKAFAYAGGEGRDVGHPFKAGTTYVAATADGGFLITNDFDRVRAFVASANGHAVTVVDAEAIWHRVTAKLDTIN
ncbi:hypothetical protein OF122_18165 [Pelagibacterium flavum]|uniref:HTH merR-type domain-containing protein n=1 Tax=Pelagibacterium flavum TaxID=2984530 RepID=A0ABY6IRU5_9HYPH|nr:hypothetical protein [Pelagibacterium sp. YIM 151497]UYQ71940.1 hypothetical protein OF122_18165 [Pelagibacterium sp. YIM 151497]